MRRPPSTQIHHGECQIIAVWHTRPAVAAVWLTPTGVTGGGKGATMKRGQEKTLILLGRFLGGIDRPHNCKED